MPSRSAFGERLTRLREKRQVTRTELAARVGVPPMTIADFELGRTERASADTLVRLAQALTTSVDYLLGASQEVAPFDGRVVAALHRLSNSSDTTIDAAVRVIDSLVEMERRRDIRKR